MFGLNSIPLQVYDVAVSAIQDLGNGQYALQRPDGTYITCNPDGSLTSAAVPNAYEKCSIINTDQGVYAVFSPWGAPNPSATPPVRAFAFAIGRLANV